MLASRTVRRASLSLNHLLLFLPWQHPLAKTGVQQGGTFRNGILHLVLTRQCLGLQTFSVPIESTSIHMCEQTHTHMYMHTPTHMHIQLWDMFDFLCYYFKVKTNKNCACMRAVTAERTPPDYHFSTVGMKYKREALTSVRTYTSKD